MAEITLHFLQQIRENLTDQGRARLELLQQSIGAVSVVDQLIAHLQAIEAPSMKNDTLGAYDGNCRIVDWNN